MSTSSRLYGENDGSKVELPVFVSPAEILFATNQRRFLLTVFNPYQSEAQLRIMTTSPDRYELSVTRGIVKPNRRMDIVIRLLNQKIEELPEPTEQLQTIDYFRITLQVGLMKGNKSVKVQWCLSTEFAGSDDSNLPLLTSDDRSPKLKLKSLKSASSNQLNHMAIGSHNSRSLPSRTGWPATHDYPHTGSNVNLICTICAIACVVSLFLPLSIDSELCKKAKVIQNTTPPQSTSFISQFSSMFSVSYEMKLGFSFALGLFTYRLISTLPD